MSPTEACRRACLAAPLVAVLLLAAGCWGPLEPPTPPTEAVEQPTPTGPLPSPIAPGPTLRPTRTFVSPASTPDSAAPTASPTASPEVARTVVLRPEIVGRIEVPGPWPPPGADGWGPTDVAVLAGRAYVANRGSANLQQAVPTGVSAAIDVGGEPVALVMHQDLERLYVLLDGGPAVVIVEDGTEVARWPLPARAHDLELAGDALYVADAARPLLRVLDARSGESLGEVMLSAGPPLRLAATADGTRLVAMGYDALQVIDTETATEDAATRSEAAQQAVVPASDGALVYVAEYDAGARESRLVARDVADLVVRGEVGLTGPASDLLRAGERIYAAVEGRRVCAYDASLAPMGCVAVGRGPSRLAYDAATGLLYVASPQSNNLTVVDAASLVVQARLPLAPQFTSLDVEPATGRLLAAVPAAGQALVLSQDEVEVRWTVGVEPAEARWLSDRALVAVLDAADDRLLLVGHDGEVTARYETGRDPQGLWYDQQQGRLYAGDLSLALDTRATQALRAPSAYQGRQPALQVLRDTRRDRLYVVAHNGIPGSNAGNVVLRLGPDGFDATAPAPGRLSVLSALYDESLDRFFTTHERMGRYGLQVASGADAAELAYVALDGRPVAMVLNQASGRLWLALEDEDGRARLRALDSQTLQVVADFAVEKGIDALAADPVRRRVYAASGAARAILVLSDGEPLVAAGEPTAEPTPSPLAPLGPAATPNSCAEAPHPRLEAAWRQLGGQAGLGCALRPAEDDAWAAQAFQRGRMLWQASTGTIYVLLNEGRYLTYEDTWSRPMPEHSCAAEPPAGLHQPIRGFGLVWCTEPDVRPALGWATEREAGLEALYQEFSRGALIWEEGRPVRALHGDGRWQVVR